MKISRFIKKTIAPLLMLSAITAPAAFASAPALTFAEEVVAPDTAKEAAENAESTGTQSEPEKDLYIPQAPDIYSGSAILMDADTGAILMDKNSHERNYPASTTKILTGLIVTSNAQLSEKLVVSEAAAAFVETGDASLNSKAGEEFSVDQALHGLLLHSANELAFALAEHVGGSVEGFAELMNKAAEDAGALDTHFVNASGLYDDNHYSTAYDMALIARECFNNPTFLAIDSETNYQIPATNLTSEPRSFANRNLLLPGMNYEYRYCVGGKTGYLPEGGHTYVSYAQKDGMRLIAVCFESGADERFSDARTMFEWGFNNFSKVSLTGTEVVAPYSDTSYLNSGRFNSGNITQSLNATYVTLPDGASLADVKAGPDPDHTTTVEDNTLVNVPIAFKYGDFTAGTADLTYRKANTSQTSNVMLPSVNPENAANTQTATSVNNPFVIDLRILIGIGLGLLAIFIIWAVVNGVRKRRERNALYKSRKRRF